MTAEPNPPSVVDPERFTVSRSITIAAPPERVWEAITKPEHIAKWSSFTPTMDRVAVGGSGAWVLENYGSTPITIEEVDPPFTITYRWGPSGADAVDPAETTTFVFTLEAVPGGTRLTVVESGFERIADVAAQLESHRQGWDSQLDALAAHFATAVVR
ncbi:MAG: SRPBCC domain-containing protein [Actinomycetota bacterium]